MASTTTMRPAQRVASRFICCQRRTFTVSATHRSQLTAKDAADRLMHDFGGKSVSRRQLIDGNQLQKMALTLNRPQLSGVDVSEDAPPDGTPVPPGYHCGGKSVLKY